MNSQNFYMEFKPTRRQRFWRSLGFALAPSVPQVEDRRGYAPGSATIITTTRLDWGDRLRVLMSGHLVTGSAIQTDVEIRGAHTTSKTVVLPPEWL